jgi:DNA-binding MarR family transcriptional regulator
MRASDCIFFQLAKASQSAVRFWGQRVAALGVTAVQSMILRFLLDEGPMTSRDLGEKTQLDSATLTGIIDRLAAQGLVTRGEHPDDRRAILVGLTETGTETARKVAALSEEANREFLKEFSGEDEGALRSFLVRIRDQG